MLDDGAMQQNAGHDQYDHALPGSGLIGSILDNDHVVYRISECEKVTYIDRTAPLTFPMTCTVKKFF